MLQSHDHVLYYKYKYFGVQQTSNEFALSMSYRKMLTLGFFFFLLTHKAIQMTNYKCNEIESIRHQYYLNISFSTILMETTSKIKNLTFLIYQLDKMFYNL